MVWEAERQNLTWNRPRSKDEEGRRRLYLNQTSSQVSSPRGFSCSTSPTERAELKQKQQCRNRSCGTLGTVQGQDDLDGLQQMQFNSCHAQFSHSYWL